jgi:hypothetical protein
VKSTSSGEKRRREEVGKGLWRTPHVAIESLNKGSKVNHGSVNKSNAFGFEHIGD